MLVVFALLQTSSVYREVAKIQFAFFQCSLKVRPTGWALVLIW